MFRLKTKPTLSSLEQQSKNLLKSFAGTADSLEAVNTEIEARQHEIDITIDVLEAEEGALEDVREKNKRVIDRIRDFLS